MSGVKKVNLTFLATLLFIELISISGIAYLTDSYAVRIVISQLTLVIPCIVYLYINRIPYGLAVRLKKIRISNLLLCVLFFILMRPLMTLINSLSLLLTSSPISDYMRNIQNDYPYIIGLLLVALLPAIVEETIYRGIFYNEYHKAKPLAAIFLSAFMFGVVHGNLNQFSYAFVMGIIFALLIEATDSILSTMTVHFLTNALSITLLYLIPELIKILENMYSTAKANGDTFVMDSIVRVLGTDDFTMEGVMQSGQEAVEAGGLAGVLSSYLIPAVIGTALAFLVYWKLAQRSGRWDYVKSLFSKHARLAYEEKREHEMQFSSDNAYQTGATWHMDNAWQAKSTAASNYKMAADMMCPTGERLITWTLAAGLIISTSELILNELVLNGIIVLP